MSGLSKKVAKCLLGLDSKNT